MNCDNGLKLEQTGIELAREFYMKVGKPILEQRFSAYMDKMAVGLVGEGSECFGFDDRISTDHDYGPSFCVWLPEKEFREIGSQMTQVYESLPEDFKGNHFQLRLPQARGRRGILDINTFYRTYIGRNDAPTELMDWLRLPDSYLAVVTNGCVFEDPLGEFSGIRERLLAYYPEDVRKKKLASRLLTMAQTGQVNYARMMRRGDTVAAIQALNQFIEKTLEVTYLLNKQYAPYYKWMWRGLDNLKKLPEIKPLLRKITLNGMKPQLWDTDRWDTYQYQLNHNDATVTDIEEVCCHIIRELRVQGISTSTSDFLQEHAYEAMMSIQDLKIRSLSIFAF